ncbi:MAG: hypothetical protein RR356_07715 [Bacteroidales bacterium]
MKGNEKRKEKKKEKSTTGKSKPLTDYQKGKSNKQDPDINLKSKI